jgi:hypothetical protein
MYQKPGKVREGTRLYGLRNIYTRINDPSSSTTTSASHSRKEESTNSLSLKNTARIRINLEILANLLVDSGGVE